ncbi:hypothetical protein EJ05DRAFT_486518 [Pseudovirgaria hyperparasitica]|uniref:DUF6604 domain-containing protein n=1 Tax=Pseudovirgaria hyperparasitica TaxID=470096 RepID=A0A6A6W6D5_9PEZI|nr:uncharacterized protein EJ05DRAFT_486518 [Pseudovirgaria hyperparasitica]KAF2757466.1 hypothetical protein EJ05DRAFT_486518 [Pseudovirgaria hyperparasitica]
MFMDPVPLVLHYVNRKFWSQAEYMAVLRGLSTSASVLPNATESFMTPTSNTKIDPVLHDTYVKYKAGTEKVVTWLAKAAYGTGLLDASFTRSTGTNAHLKRHEQNNRQTSEQTFDFEVKDLNRFADVIVSSNLKVPPAILYTLDDVIVARRECASWYRRQLSTDNDAHQKRNESHDYYISILQKMRSKLASTTREEKQEFNGAFDRRDAWTEYKERRITLETAAVIHNTALGLCREVNLHFIKYFPHLSDHATIITFMDGSYKPSEHQQHGDWRYFVFTSHQGDEFALYQPVITCNTVHRMTMSLMTMPVVSWYEHRRAPLLTDDEDNLMFCVSYLTLLSVGRLKTMDNDDDMMVQAILQSRTDGIYYSWAVFALQSLTDCQRILGKDRSRGFQDLQASCKWYKESIEATVRFGYSSGVSKWHEKNESILLGMVSDFSESVEEDELEALYKLNQSAAGKVDREKFFFMKKNPMLCGLKLMKLLLSFHQLGLELVNNHFALLTAIHTYNAFLDPVNTASSHKWTDLETIIKRQDSKKVFAGDRPTESGDHQMHFALALGADRAKLLKLRRKQKGRMKLAWRGGTIGSMSTYLHSCIKKAGKIVNLHRLIPNFVTVAGLVARSVPGASNDPGSARLSSLEVLSVLKESLSRDAIFLRWDLFAMNKHSLEFILKITEIRLDSDNSQPKKNSPVGFQKLPGVMLHVLGFDMRSSPRFPELCAIVNAHVASVSAVESQKAMIRCGTVSQNSPPHRDGFFVPIDDFVPHSLRQNAKLFSVPNLGLQLLVSRSVWRLDNTMRYLEVGGKLRNLRFMNEGAPGEEAVFLE